VDEEVHSVWYIFTAQEDGQLGFLITPNNPTDDYDWIVWDLTGKTCADLATDPSLVVSCNAAGGGACNGNTGATGATSQDDQGAGCFNSTAFNDLIPTQAGRTYVLLLVNWTQSDDGYTLDFGLSSGIGIDDGTRPTLDLRAAPTGCGDRDIDLRFSEYVNCDALLAADVAITGPGGPYTTQLLPQCDNRARTTRLRLRIEPPLQSLGSFEVRLASAPDNPITDLCGNELLPFSASFVADRPGELVADVLPDETYFCAGDSLVIDLTDQLTGPFLWADGSTAGRRALTQPGVYRVAYEDVCGAGSDSIRLLAEAAPPFFEFPGEAVICSGENTLLGYPQLPGHSYRWNDSLTVNERRPTEDGTYRLSVTNACGTYSDAADLIVDRPLTLDLGRDTFLCPDETLRLDPALAGSRIAYLWENGDTLPQREVVGPGTYLLQASNACGTERDTLVAAVCEVCDIYLPNAFSPNNDGTNDRFRAYSDCDLLDYRLRVYDRWGGLVYAGDSREGGWDGRDLADGLYLYLFECEVVENGYPRRVQQQGEVILLR
jgi:gliding motility-associated-like protein